MPESPEKKHPSCILCGRCLEVCPLFRVTAHEELSPRGKAFLVQSFSSMNISSKEASKLAGLCIGCGRCTRVCPQGIDLPRLISSLKNRHPEWKNWLLARMLTNGSFFLPLTGLGGRLLGQAGGTQIFSPPRRPITPLFRTRVSRRHSGQGVVFPGCLGRFLRRDLEKKAVHILGSTGLEVLPTPAWKCCGLPLAQAGFIQEQQSCMRANLKIWHELGRPRVYTICATCRKGLTEAQGPEDLLEDVERLAQNIFPLSRILLDLGVETLPHAGPQELVWHEPCHGTKGTAQALQNLLKTKGLGLKVPDGQCCGLGGAFRLQAPRLSLHLAQDLWKNLSPQPSSLCLTECAGCMIQLASTRPRDTQTAHWLELFQD
ncbi:(Fe-S)-binding protein [Desulfonatronospira sp.]|uniref:(Fe-S)-binding protein n=1 Tax=Desulfonatronospira sp. TaxID=1962951 RepID=UPI0025C57E53|nr:(Fe-S)-binding protein [Desulfonatronospira sp.]